MENRNDREFSFEIMKHIGVLNRNKNGWSREANIVSWNGGAPKFDIREWDPEHERMSRGITLSEKEMERLLESVREKMPEVKAMMNDYRMKQGQER